MPPIDVEDAQRMTVGHHLRHVVNMVVVAVRPQRGIVGESGIIEMLAARAGDDVEDAVGACLADPSEATVELERAGHTPILAAEVGRLADLAWTESERARPLISVLVSAQYD